MVCSASSLLPARQRSQPSCAKRRAQARAISDVAPSMSMYGMETPVWTFDGTNNHQDVKGYTAVSKLASLPFPGRESLWNSIFFAFLLKRRLVGRRRKAHSGELWAFVNQEKVIFSISSYAFSIDLTIERRLLLVSVCTLFIELPLFNICIVRIYAL